MPPELISERLRLNRLGTSDAAFIFDLVNTDGWLRFIGDRNVRSLAEAEAYVDRMNTSENVTYWVVRKKHEESRLGVVTFMKRAYLDHFDIGFAFLPQYNGQGYAREAASEVLTAASKHPLHRVVHATTLPDNIRSIKLLSKLGLAFERELSVATEKLHLYTIHF
jgi:[ribosomal protein S5]-alanine N-acetyltransferase